MLPVILETPAVCTNVSVQNITFLVDFFSDFNMGVAAIVNSIRQYFSINPETTSIYSRTPLFQSPKGYGQKV